LPRDESGSGCLEKDWIATAAAPPRDDVALSMKSVEDGRTRVDRPCPPTHGAGRSRQSEEAAMARNVAKRKPEDEQLQASGLVAREQLKAFVERIERLEEEKKAIADDIKDVFAEAKGNGYDIKALRTIIRMRKQDVDERREQEAILDLYMQALGMVPGGGSAATDEE
jgi:uncharacterized protein (UPF0335 family)